MGCSERWWHHHSWRRPRNDWVCHLVLWFCLHHGVWSKVLLSVAKEIPYQKAGKEEADIQKHSGRVRNARVAAVFMAAVASRGEAWTV